MQADDIPITFQSVARYANVSKSWLYAQTDITTHIKALRGQSDTIKRLRDYPKQLRQKNDDIAILNERVRQLLSENEQLKRQLETLYGELYNNNNNNNDDTT